MTSSHKFPKSGRGACSIVPRVHSTARSFREILRNFKYSHFTGKNKAFLKTIKPPTSSTFASAEVNAIETENENEMASAYPSAHGPGHPMGPVEVTILS